MEIDFLGLKKKGVSEPVGGKTGTDSDSAITESGGQTRMSSNPGCSYSGLDLFNDQQRKYLPNSSHPPQHFSSLESIPSLGKKNYNKASNLNFSEKLIPMGVMSKFAGSTAGQPQDFDAMESLILDRRNDKLTMFYANSVYVFDQVSLEKAQAILSMAEHDRHANLELTKPEVVKNAVCGFPPPSSIRNSSTYPPETHTMGISQARKASLFRFLEKRKHRLKGAIPFNLTTNPCSSSDCSYPLASANH